MHPGTRLIEVNISKFIIIDTSFENTKILILNISLFLYNKFFGMVFSNLFLHKLRNLVNFTPFSQKFYYQNTC